MNNKEFIQALAKRTETKTSECQSMVKSVFSSVTAMLQDDETVTMARLGTFDVKKRMERVIQNPGTGQRMLVPPKLVINFRPMNSAKEKYKTQSDTSEE